MSYKRIESTNHSGYHVESRYFNPSSNKMFIAKLMRENLSGKVKVSQNLNSFNLNFQNSSQKHIKNSSHLLNSEKTSYRLVSNIDVSKNTNYNPSTSNDSQTNHKNFGPQIEKNAFSKIRNFSNNKFIGGNIHSNLIQNLVVDSKVLTEKSCSKEQVKESILNRKFNLTNYKNKRKPHLWENEKRIIVGSDSKISTIDNDIVFDDEKRTECLKQAYKNDKNIMRKIYERLNEIKQIKKYRFLQPNFSLSFEAEKSPYSVLLSKINLKKRNHTRQLCMDELATEIPKFINDKLNQIYKKIASQKAIKKNIYLGINKNSKDFIEEKDYVNNLNTSLKNSKIQEKNSLTEASYLKSCGSRSINLLHKSTFKFKLNVIPILSKKINDSLIEYDEKFAKENFEIKNLNVEKEYESLEKEMGNLIKWKPGEIVGQGKFGQVLQCFDSSSGKLFVAKRIKINSKNTPQIKKQMDELSSEIGILNSLSHQNIVKYIGSETLGTEYFIYMEYISGGSIRSILDKYGPLEERTIKIYTKQLLNGLLYLHTKKIIHMDIKAANILISSDGIVKLSDFGCSANLDFAKSKNELVQTIRGSLPWMAPEVIKNKAYSLKSDIWSLGCTIIEMATGKPPWGDFDNMMNAIYFISRTDQIPEIPDHLSKNAKFFIKECLNRNVENRPNILELFDFPFIRKN